MLNAKNGQTFSTDFIVAIAIFIGSLLFFYSFLASGNIPKSELLQEESVFIARQIAEKTSVLYFVDGAEVAEKNLERLANEEYASIKGRAGIGYDFTIHFEDANGIVPIKEGKDKIGPADISLCDDKDVIKAYKLVNRKGFPLRIVITACG